MGPPKARRGRRCLPRPPRGSRPPARPRAATPGAYTQWHGLGRPPGGCYSVDCAATPQTARAGASPTPPPGHRQTGPLPALPALAEREEGGGGRDTGTPGPCQWQGKGEVLSLYLVWPRAPAARQDAQAARQVRQAAGSARSSGMSSPPRMSGDRGRSSVFSFRCTPECMPLEEVSNHPLESAAVPTTIPGRHSNGKSVVQLQQYSVVVQSSVRELAAGEVSEVQVGHDSHTTSTCS